MTIDTTDLKKAAEACDILKCSDDAEYGRRLAEFFEQCEPESILDLLADIERLRSVAQQEINIAGERAKEVCGARMTLHALTSERDQLKAENEALRKDAERFKWLIAQDMGIAEGCVGYACDSICRQVIDAAMAKEAPHG